MASVAEGIKMLKQLCDNFDILPKHKFLRHAVTCKMFACDLNVHGSVQFFKSRFQPV